MTHCLGNLVRRRRPGDWTEEETELLRSLAKEGLTRREAAERLGRSEKSVWGRAWRAGIRWARTQNWWSDDEIRLLRHYAKLHSREEAARLLGRGERGVEDKAIQLGISFWKYGDSNPAAKVSREQIVEMFELRAGGQTFAQIGERFGISGEYARQILEMESRWRDSLPMLLEKQP